jgi:aspartyl/asparaginyl beta-hydroxylase (cupin superfamily)
MTRMAQSVADLTGWAARREIDPDRLTRVFAGLASADRADRAGADLQEPLLLFPGLRAEPWHDPAEFDWVTRLEEAYPRIRAEFEKVHDGLGVHPEAADLAAAGTWRTYYFHHTGRPDERHLSECPHTARVLAGIPGVGASGMCYFSVMSPDTEVKPHCGFANIRIRCHLGLVVPGDCWMRVGRETRTWAEGECLVFDDSFEHEVANGGQGARAVLLLDVWHPDLTATEKEALAHLMTHWATELD